MTADQARETVNVIAHTIACLEEERSRFARWPSEHAQDAARDEIVGGYVAIGQELFRLVAAGHVAELARLGDDVERWRQEYRGGA